ncbi:MAG: histidinol dehydrogenase [Gemmatimonadetes bacterium]|nr:histidinol dehydrogenase [Gemmatimonadota bacterium]
MRLAVEGSLSELGRAQERLLFERAPHDDPELAGAVREIVAQIRERGDAALRELARRYDGAALEALEVPRQRWERALEALDRPVREGLERAAAHIARFHQAQLPPALELEVAPGVVLGRRVEPLRAVGAYAPGGRAAYPSTVLMCVVPAKVAGVDEIVVCSPPGPTGEPADAVLAACALARADRLFAVGGAGAVAALAFGTETVPRVDAIVGPGNRYVTEAKRQLAGRVLIDCPAGPSELLVIAEDGAEGADPALIAVELCAQAEHDPDAAVACVATSPALARNVWSALETRLPREPRREIIEAALAARGAILACDGLDDALAFAERYAPEHLLLLTRDPRGRLERVRAAGTVFLGPHSSVAFGDYLTGANHVLPTGGLARSFSGLSVLNFLRVATYQEVGPEAAAALAEATRVLAHAEGLPAHAAAAEARRPS